MHDQFKLVRFSMRSFCKAIKAFSRISLSSWILASFITISFTPIELNNLYHVTYVLAPIRVESCKIPQIAASDYNIPLIVRFQKCFKLPASDLKVLDEIKVVNVELGYVFADKLFIVE
jgi:hypothetical protein